MINYSKKLITLVNFTYKILDNIPIRNLSFTLRKDFSLLSSRLRSAESTNYFLIQLPKFLLETIFLTATLILVNQNISTNLSALLAVVYAYQRIFICFQSLNSSRLNLKIYKPILIQVAKYFNLPSYRLHHHYHSTNILLLLLHFGLLLLLHLKVVLYLLMETF